MFFFYVLKFHGSKEPGFRLMGRMHDALDGDDAWFRGAIHSCMHACMREWNDKIRRLGESPQSTPAGLPSMLRMVK